MTIRQFLFGPRWSLLFIHGGTQKYELYGDSVIAILGVIGSLYMEGLKPVTPWELYLYSHRAKRSFKIYQSYFLPGNRLSPSLFDELERLGHDYSETIDEPTFEELETRRKLPIAAPPIIEYLSQGGDLKRYAELHENSFLTVMDRVFG